MNKVISIRLGHYVLTVDEDAAHAISAYTDALRRKYAGEEGAEEIVSDIEERMGELLEKKQKANHLNFSTLSDVQEVIAQLGPLENEDIPNMQHESSRRRLFRDPDNRILGGVWGGVGAFFDIDPVILRVIWVISVFALGFGVPLYIILWVVIPEANTTAEKLMMKGQRPTLRNIEDNVKAEMSGVGARFNTSGTRDRLSQFLRALVIAFAKSFSIVFRFFMSLAGAVLLMILIAVLIAVSTNTIYVHNYHFVLNGQEGLNTVLTAAGNPLGIKILVIVFILLVMAWVGLVVFSNRNNRDRIVLPRRYIGWSAICAALIFFVFAFDGIRSISSRSERRAYEQVLPVTGDTLYVSSTGINTDIHGLYTLNKFADILPSDDDHFRIEQHNVTYGHNRLSSASRNNSVGQQFTFENNKVTLAQGQKISNLSQNGLGWVIYVLYVPKGKTVVAAKDFLFPENNYSGLTNSGKTISIDTLGYATPASAEGISLSSHIESLDIEGKFDVQIIKSDRNRLELVSGPILSHRDWLDSDGSHIRIAEHDRWFTEQPSYIRIYLNNLEHLEAGPVSRVRFSNWTGNRLEIESDGAGSVEGNLIVKELIVDVEGTARVNLSGSADYLKVDASGASSFTGLDLKADRVSATANGASNISVWVEKELDGDASGASGISAKGNPVHSHVETSGASTFRKI